MLVKLSEVIHKQPILNIGCTGHVANGKSTLVRMMTNVATQKFKSEKERNITIKIGYAGCKIFYSKKLDEFKFRSSDIIEEKDSENNIMDLIYHFSFVDCPGHESFMNNMLTGTSVMDMAFLVEDISSEKIPKIQTKEHMIALSNSDITNIIVLANKCDLVKKTKIEANKEKLCDFIEEYYEEGLDIIPTIAQKGVNLEYVVKSMLDNIKDYKSNINDKLYGVVIRSFDINKPNIKIEDYKGGVLGGSIKSGLLKIGDYIQINPGIVKFDKKLNVWRAEPIVTKVETLNADKTSLEYAIPGGLIGIGTTLDPSLCKSNKCVGQHITHFNKNPKIVYEIDISYMRFKRDKKVKLEKNDKILVGNAGNIIEAVILKKHKNKLKLTLKAPIYLNAKRICLISDKDNKMIVIGIANIDSYKLVENISINYNDIPIPEEEHILENDILKPEIDIVDFDIMLNNITAKVKPKKLCLKEKFKLVPNNSKTQHTFKNYNSMIRDIRHENDKLDISEIFTSELEKYLKCKTSFNGNNELIIGLKIKTDILNKEILKNILKIKKCKSCSSLDTYIYRDSKSRLLYLHCQSCESKNSF